MLTTYMQHDHITKAYADGTASYAVADIARELVALYRADITGPQAIAAATTLDAQGITGPQVHYMQVGDQTRKVVTAAVEAARPATTGTLAEKRGHIAEARTAGAIGYNACQIAMMLVEHHDITGLQAVEAATYLDCRGFKCGQIELVYTLGALVDAAVEAVR